MNNVLKVVLAISLFVNIFLVVSYNQDIELVKQKFHEIDGYRINDIQILSSLSVNKVNKSEVLDMLKINFPKIKHTSNENENSIWTNKLGTLRIYFDKESVLNRVWIDPFAKYE